ncbi:S8 family peptidase [Chryseobacterium taiwanense]|uniref:Secretion protein Por n=1 Tax=Chryseobacterium taiwanense TaxID=363331 RepID=A0A0B4E3Z0_9FLAO|nr:S8 family peptidase [Chryseobacterium taiwanense]KIC61323.1 secretion protein Por [Chryseobacterium taiwanense]
MKKHLLLISSLAATLMSAQNETLKTEFARQNKENNEKFNAYVTKIYGTNIDPEKQQEIEKLRSSLAGFNGGVPYFLKSHDTRQLLNSNSDLLNTSGNITGLTGAFNGENIKYTVFDGGRVYASHVAFNNSTGRITNKEASTENFSDHATGVSSFIGGRDVPLSSNNVPVGNAKGVAINSTIDSYMFDTTTLPGNTATSTVFEKILIAQPAISNHSYGIDTGWIEEYDNNGNLDSFVYNGFRSGSTFYDYQGTYTNDDRNYDMIVYSNPSYIIVKSAGNSYGSGPGGTGSNAPRYYRTATGTGIASFNTTDPLPPNNCALGYDCIGSGSLAKNIIVVGATNIITSNNNRYTTAGDVVHSNYSSAGPRDDGGIKPDISTVGTNVFYAATVNSAGSSTWAAGSGTSFSGPIVTGIIGLWTQINKQLFNNTVFNAASAKALTIHSASEAGNIGPDPHFGWGFINAKRGAELLVGKSNNTVVFKDETLTSGVKNSQTVKASGSEPLKVTISWIDPHYTPSFQSVSDVFNNRTSRLINDLDVRVIDTTNNTIYYPWKLNANSPMTPATKADNNVDNVEQVVIDAPVAGRSYRIEITNKGTLVNNTGVSAPQNYSIIVTGFNEVLGTKDLVNSTHEISIAPTLTKDVINIIKAPRKSTFTLYDLSGKRLQSGVISNDQESINISAYMKGIYIVEVKTDKDIISKKIIKD